MICKRCGTVNEEYMEYCKNCSEELIPDADIDTSNEQSGTEDEAPVWGMLRMPKWKRPEFSADDADDDIDDSKDTPLLNNDDDDDIKPYIPASQMKKTAPTQLKSDSAEQEYEYFVDDEDEESEKKHARANSRPARKGVRTNRDDRLTTDEDAATSSETKRFAPAIEDSYFYDSIDDDASSENKPNKRDKKSSKGLIIGIAVAAVLVVAVVFSFIFISSNYGSIDNFMSHVFEGNPLMRPVTIDLDKDAEGNDQVIFYINATEGYTVRFTINDQVVERTIGAGNSFSGSLLLSSFMPQEPIDSDSDYIVITPILSIVSPDGTVVTPITSFATSNASIIDVLAPESTAEERSKGVMVEGIPVFVPSLTLNITEPTGDTFATESSQVIIKGTVSDNSAEVYANGEQVQIDSLGSFEYALTMAESGDYKVEFEARKSGYRIARRSITVAYTKPAVSIDLSFSITEGIQLRTKTNTITISGKIDPGATIELSSDKTGITFGDVTYAADGTFTFTATIDRVDFFDVNAKITLGTDVADKTIHIERAPDDYRAYYESAYEFDYDRCLNEPNHAHHYEVIGYVTEVIQTESFTIAKLETANGQVVYFQYHNSYTGAATVEVSSTQIYRLAAVPNGTYNDADGNPHPYMYVWFAIKPGSGNN